MLNTQHITKISQDIKEYIVLSLAEECLEEDMDITTVKDPVLRIRSQRIGISGLAKVIYTSDFLENLLPSDVEDVVFNDAIVRQLCANLLKIDLQDLRTSVLTKLKELNTNDQTKN